MHRRPDTGRHVVVGNHHEVVDDRGGHRSEDEEDVHNRRIPKHGHEEDVHHEPLVGGLDVEPERRFDLD